MKNNVAGVACVTDFVRMVKPAGPDGGAHGKGQGMKLSTLAERQIRKAEAEGQFANLKGAGKPLGEVQDGSAEAIGFRIMAEAGALPREIALRKEVAEAASRLAAETDPAARREAQARLAEIELRLAIEVEARRRFGRD